MSYDLALSENSDLIVAANRDLAGISGIDLIEQRIRLRLRMRRGSWVYDETKTMGSNLYRLHGMSAEEAHQALGPYVREALRPMTEITIDDVQHIHEDQEGSEDSEGHAPVSSSITVIVFYTLNIDEQGGQPQAPQQISVSIPIGGGGV